MLTETMKTIRSILVADPEVTVEQVEVAIKAVSESSQRKRDMGTKREAAEILDIHPESVKRYARRGLLHPVRITARRVRYDLNECRRLAEYGASATQVIGITNPEEVCL